ncbi:MAG TPA: 1-deoxy-D-xylulose-5-phosphate synthase [Chlamydiales bacterium]|nr:1-deoxy-D-xylulose-5-phosphate synthase [Chlamydiales bacterium]
MKLSKISSPEDLKKFRIDELYSVAEEIRSRIIEVLSVKGGHLSSNLGIVELSIALHYSFHSPYDKFIFDVSHQTYPHKLLTGRNHLFETIRQFKGLCGFSHPEESPHDHFFAGHAGTALSLALGVAKNRDLSGRKEHILPILGDASLTCGLTLEALNNVPRELKNFIVVLNDNEMSISQNVGNIKNIMSARQFIKGDSFKHTVSPAAFFEQFGLTYVGPIDGHDIRALIAVFESLKHNPRSIILHVLTTKGKGMPMAIQNPTPYHGCKPFDLVSGKFLPTPSNKPTFPKIFGKHLLKMAENDPGLVAITPAMPAGSCLDDFMAQFPERCLDVGIAEGHSVTFAGGIAYGCKMKVVAVIYATFLQRALDNLFQDVCLQELPVIFALDRAFISGPDGSTHHGIYDIAFLNAMPNMIIVQPRDGHLLKELLESAFHWGRPTAIRYPNLVTDEPDLPVQYRELGKGEIIYSGEEIAIIALGHMCSVALEVKDLLQKEGLNPTIVDPVFAKPLDTELFCDLLSNHSSIVTLEEHSLQGGLGSIINSFIVRNGFHPNVLNLGIPDTFVQHGANKDLLQELQLDAKSIAKRILSHFDSLLGKTIEK